MGSGATTGPVPARQTLYGPHRGLFGGKKAILLLFVCTCVCPCMRSWELSASMELEKQAIVS